MRKVGFPPHGCIGSRGHVWTWEPQTITCRTSACILALLLALANSTPHLLLAAEPPQRTLIRSAPAGKVYSYENAAGETVEEVENWQGRPVYRRFYRPAPPACAASA